MSDEIKRLRDQLARVQTALYDTRPKQAVGEMVEHAITLADRLEARAGEAVSEVAMTSGSQGGWQLVWFRDPDSLPARSRLYLHPPTGDAAGKDSVDAAKPRHWNPVYNTDPVRRACSELPEGYEIEIGLERDAGWVGLCGPDGGMIEFNDDADCFDWKIHAAIDAAIASLTKTADGEKQS
jgi:hypothetical protein